MKRQLILLYALAILPVEGVISSPYGPRINPINRIREFHTGIDISSRYALAVKSVKNGIVTFSGKNGGYGNLVIINHGDGVETYYGHLGRTFVKMGDFVIARQTIGWTGLSGKSTGTHVHFEVRHKGQPVNPHTLTGVALPISRFTSPPYHSSTPPTPKIWCGGKSVIALREW